MKPPPLAAMYLGAKMVRLRPDNPEFISHAGHSIRELIDALPGKYPNVPVFDHVDLVSRSRSLIDAWTAYQGAAPGVKAHLGATFESTMQGFATDMAGVRVTRREQAGALMGAMDPSGRPLPPVIAELRVDEWGAYRAFFVRACHHGLTTPEDFDRMLELFEEFLIDRLGLRTFRSQAALEAIVAEGERHA